MASEDTKPPPKAITIGISGCSSSGKTTLARLLRDIFPSTFILHQDDFYLPETSLPTKHGLLDWDCAAAISIPDLESALSHIRTHGTFPPTISSKEDQNSVGTIPVTDAQLSEIRNRVSQWLSPGSPGHKIFSSEIRICLLDGFLLYSPPEFTQVMSNLDIKLFLLVSREKATRRREARDGYVTLEGFWTDPPGYVDKIVWPNYVEAHRWLFDGGDVEGGMVREEVLDREGIRTPGGVDVEFGEVLEWAVGEVMRRLEELVLE
ncbi:hypothetical protein OQA88_12164 [Cercophora sp. LCS_1]